MQTQCARIQVDISSITFGCLCVTNQASHSHAASTCRPLRGISTLQRIKVRNSFKWESHENACFCLTENNTPPQRSKPVTSMPNKMHKHSERHIGILNVFISKHHRVALYIAFLRAKQQMFFIITIMPAFLLFNRIRLCDSIVSKCHLFILYRLFHQTHALAWN